MYETFLRLRGLHELLSLLATAGTMVSEVAWRARLEAQRAQVDAACAQVLAGEPGGEAGTLRARTFALLRELAALPSIGARRR